MVNYGAYTCDMSVRLNKLLSGSSMRFIDTEKKINVLIECKNIEMNID